MRVGLTLSRRAGWLAATALGAALWAAQAGTQREPGPIAPPRTLPTTADPERDPRIEDMVFLRLVASPTVSAHSIRFEVERGIVTLRGVVPTAEAADRARRIAAWTPGVRGVCADVTVDPAFATPRDAAPPPDDTIAEEVARTLAGELLSSIRLHHSWVWGWQIDGGWWGFDVDVDGGDVVLSGSAPTVPDVRRAVELARTVPGARTVRSLLYVRGTSARAAVIFSPHGPYFGYDQRPDEPIRPGYGYYGRYPPPRGTALPDYPSATCPARPGAADEPAEPRTEPGGHGKPGATGGGRRRVP